MTSEQPKVDTEPNGYTELFRSSAKGILTDEVLFALGLVFSVGVVVNSFLTFHLYVEPLTIFETEAFTEHFSSTPDVYHPIYVGMYTLWTWAAFVLRRKYQTEGDV